MRTFRKTLEILGVILISLALISCNSSKLTQADLDRAREETKLGEHYIDELESDLLKVVSLIYSPISQEDMDRAFEILEKYGTKAFLSSFKNGTNKFKESGNRLSNIEIELGSPKNQLDNTYKFMVTFTIENSGYSKRMAIEFVFTDVGKLVNYDVWYLEAF